MDDPVLFGGASVVIGVIIVLLVIWGIATYNRLIKTRNRSKEALQGIDVALETRVDQVKAQADVASGIVQKEVELMLKATSLRTGRTIRDLSVPEIFELNTSLKDAEQYLLQQIHQGPGSYASFEAYPQMQIWKNMELLQCTNRQWRRI